MKASHLAGAGALLFFAFTLGMDHITSPAPVIHGTPNSIRFEGMERSFRLFEPSGEYEKSSFPLIVVLHGGGGNAKGMVRLTQGGFNHIAEREGAYVVYPEGVRRHWNEGRDMPLSYAHRANINDVGFIETLVKKLSAEFPIDPQRVFVTGMSNGGLMAYRLACARPDLFAAIAPVTASIPKDILDLCKTASGTGLMVVNGTDDPQMPYKGGEISVFGASRGEVISTPATIDHWLRLNGCPTHSQKKMMPDVSRRDETTVTRYFYSGCETDVKVALYRVEGGGHTWPGGRQYLREERIGKTSRDINACEEIWRFFEHF